AEHQALLGVLFLLFSHVTEGKIQGNCGLKMGEAGPFLPKNQEKRGRFSQFSPEESPFTSL
ncbi:hypothetical protein ACLUXJ_09105, partial [Lactobacillus porci]|uniref:hypothetical protein n=1 Tax=Lactobacillus porci TaxID=2012477 RepID=UPI0039935553